MDVPAVHELIPLRHQILSIEKLSHGFSPWIAVAEDHEGQREEEYCSDIWKKIQKVIAGIPFEETYLTKLQRSKIGLILIPSGLNVP